MSLIWMPPQTTDPPGFTARSASGTRSPTGAKMIAASRGSGGGLSESPVQTATMPSANAPAFSSPTRSNERNPPPPAMSPPRQGNGGGAPNAKEAPPLPYTANFQCPPADETGA